MKILFRLMFSGWGGGRGTSTRHSYASTLLMSLPERESIAFTLFATGMIIKIRDT